MSTLKDKTMIVSGGSRGIGLEIAKRAATDGANVILLAKTGEPHPKLPGTVYTAADEIREAGGQALPVVGDVRNEDDVASAVAQGVKEFGGIDIVVNNASAINLSPPDKLPMKRFDLMNNINMRGTYLLTAASLEALKKSEDPRILTLSPPLNLSQKWLGAAPGYMLAKYGMTLAALGIGANTGIPSTTLWPKTTIATAAVQYELGGTDMYERSRTPQVYSDSAYAVLTADAKKYAGESVLCEDVLADAGVTDFSKYSVNPEIDESDLSPDIFVD